MFIELSASQRIPKLKILLSIVPDCAVAFAIAFAVALAIVCAPGYVHFLPIEAKFHYITKI